MKFSPADSQRDQGCIVENVTEGGQVCLNDSFVRTSRRGMGVPQLRFRPAATN
ncbi:hypothetical protein [Streptomyces sp. NPDC053720]|uniref:hypothetical protein n=1 Tax=Streptomyces sp. NPDC053720 TaxID=3154855 RepID=UPI0034328154